ncbi:MAG: HAD family hydrolase [Candidatus Eisenbacteria bacterium]
MSALKIRLLLLDIDGTLVGHGGVHASTWPALDEARRAGVTLGLCTGRIGLGFARELARQVAPDGLHIFQSGAVVSRPGGPAAHASTLPPEAFRALVETSRREREPLEAFTPDGFYLESHTELLRVHAHHLELQPVVTDLLALTEPVVRAQWVVDESRWPHFRALTEALPGLAINPATAPWAPGAVFSNITRAGTNKGTALRWLAAHLGLAIDEVAMVGDGENDLDAITAAGLGIAMGDAHARVKAAARLTVARADDGGVAEAVRAVLAG